MRVYTRGVDEWLSVGDSVAVSPTDIDPAGARLIARGRIVGGADDGERFEKAFELAPGSSFDAGPLVRVTVIEIVGGAVRLGVLAPPNVEVRTGDVTRQQ